MAKQAGAGDKTGRWRESYMEVRKDLLRDNQATNRSRLRLLGLDALPRNVRLLDVGAGDGNLFQTLRELGFTEVWGLEYQPELIAKHPSPDRVVAASAADIPYRTASMSAVMVMDVLHHLMPVEISSCFAEIRRVLKPGGHFYMCEPASTLLRKLLMIGLMSPLGGVSRFSRHKRAMVEQERQTLEPWLEAEHAVAERIEGCGFKRELFKRFWLHNYGRFRAL